MPKHLFHIISVNKAQSVSDKLDVENSVCKIVITEIATSWQFTYYEVILHENEPNDTESENEVSQFMTEFYTRGMLSN
jgi:hypothetical protein